MHGSRNSSAAAGGVLALFLFGGSYCAVGVKYCSEDCDPCLQVCQCTTHCPSGQARDFADAYRMRRFVLALERRPDGTWTQSYGAFVGLSLERALGPRAHDPRAIELFARNVIIANAEHLGTQSDWSLAAMERADSGLVVTFERPGEPDAALVFLLDRAGNLLEIARHGRS